jgi:hypothetical protein
MRELQLVVLGADVIMTLEATGRTSHLTKGFTNDGSHVTNHRLGSQSFHVSSARRDSHVQLDWSLQREGPSELSEPCAERLANGRIQRG